MKVAYVLNSTDVFGGATKSFTAMLYTLMDKGIEPLVVMPDGNGLKHELDAKGIATLVLNYRPNTYPYHSCLKDYLLWIPRLIARRIVNCRATRELYKHITMCDLVHTNVSVIDIGKRAADKLRIPHVYHFREYADLDFGEYYFPYRRRFLSSVSYSIFITRGIQEYNHLQSSPSSCVVYNPIATGDKIPDFDTQGTYLLYAGRLEETKGIEDLLKAYANASTHLPLYVAGSFLKASYENKVMGMVSKLHLTERVRFLGNRKDILPLMAKAKATIIPSHFEGFGRVMAEAMFQGCIVIGRNTSGTKEQFDNGLSYTGAEIGFRFSTISELAEIINNIETFPTEELSLMRKRAFQTVKHFYTYENSSKSIFSFYERINSSK